MYDPIAIMAEIEERSAWIEYKQAEKRNQNTTFEEYRQIMRDREALKRECAAAVARCLERRGITA